MAVETIYRQQWGTTFSRPTEFQSHTPAGPNYNPITGYAEYYDGAAMRVVTPGTAEFDPTSYGVGDDYAAGIIFYQIGDETVSGNPGVWDQRDTIIEITYNHKALTDNEGRFLTISRGLFQPSWMLELLSAANLNVRYRLHGTGATQNDTFSTAGIYSEDGLDHVWKFVIQPGTLTGDPMVAGFSVAADGYWQIYVDDVLVRSMSGIALTMGFNSGTDFAKNPVHNDAVWIGKDGLIGPTQDLHIYRESTPLRVWGIGAGAAVDDRAKVTSDLTFLANLDGLGRTVHEPNTFYIAGHLKVTGTTTFEGDVVASSPETLINSIVTTGSEIVLDSDGNIVFVNGS